MAIFVLSSFRRLTTSITAFAFFALPVIVNAETPRNIQRQIKSLEFLPDEVLDELLNANGSCVYEFFEATCNFLEISQHYCLAVWNEVCSAENTLSPPHFRTEPSPEAD